MRGRRLAAGAFGVGVALALAGGVPVVAGTSPGSAPGSAAAAGALADTSSTLSAEAEAYVLRAEYDIPLPAGTGTVGHVVGEIRRSSGGDNAKGLAGAPTELDAVVSGKYADPNGTGHVQNRPPQTECFYPGQLLDTSFRFPTDTRAETAATPALSWASARCGAGPEMELHAVDGGTGVTGTPGAGVAPLARATAVESDAQARTVHGVIEATTRARANDVRVLGGVLTVASVEVNGHSEVTGRAGGGHSVAEVVLHDVSVAGVTFSVAGDRLVVGGRSIPVDGAPAQALVDRVNGALRPATGCRIDLATSPTKFPKGFVLARKDPDIGIARDGHLAASMRGGLLVLCDVPRAVSDPSGFSPQRAQLLIGFAYTAARAIAEPGGFRLGDLVGLVGGAGVAPTANALTPPAVPAALGPPVRATPTVGDVRMPAAGDRPGAAPAARGAPAASIAFRMDPARRLLLAVVCLLGWAAVTRAGLIRLTRGSHERGGVRT